MNPINSNIIHQFIKFNIITTIFILPMMICPIKTDPLPRPESANLPTRQFGNIPNHTNINYGNTGVGSDKIIIPLKEYSNKFFREGKTNEDSVYSHGVLKPKKLVTFTRKQLNNKRRRQVRYLQDKENQIKRIKTEPSEQSSANQSLEKYRSLKTASAQAERSFSTPNNKQKISASRALEIFSKVFRNETLERMRVRRQIICRELDVHVKQIKLNGKDKKPKHIVGLARKFNLHPCSLLHKPKEQAVFLDDQNFQLAGW